MTDSAGTPWAAKELLAAQEASHTMSLCLILLMYFLPI
jgi:hypothetical protein